MDDLMLKVRDLGKSVLQIQGVRNHLKYGGYVKLRN